MRSDVRVVPGPPPSDRRSFLRVSCPKRRAPSACGIRLDGAIAQLGERVLCKHEVVGSIPSGSTILLRRSAGQGGMRSAMVVIVLRLSAKICFAPSIRPACPADCARLYDIVNMGIDRSHRGNTIGSCGDGSQGLRHDRWVLTAPSSTMRSWSFQRPSIPSGPGASWVWNPAEGWASTMRTIKCLKGIRWMPWR